MVFFNERIVDPGFGEFPVYHGSPDYQSYQGRKDRKKNRTGQNGCYRTVVVSEQVKKHQKDQKDGQSTSGYDAPVDDLVSCDLSCPDIQSAIPPYSTDLRPDRRRIAHIPCNGLIITIRQGHGKYVRR